MGLVQTFVFRQTLERKQEILLAHAPTQSGRVPFTVLNILTVDLGKCRDTELFLGKIKPNTIYHLATT